MSRKNNDSIERFFRKAVNDSDTRFRESDWQKMEQMLDADAARRSAARAKTLKRSAFVATGVVLLFLSAYYLFVNTMRGPERPKALPEQSQATADRAKAPMVEGKKTHSAADLLSSPDHTSALKQDLKNQYEADPETSLGNEQSAKEQHAEVTNLNNRGAGAERSSNKSVPIIASQDAHRKNQVRKDVNDRSDRTVEQGTVVNKTLRSQESDQKPLSGASDRRGPLESNESVARTEKAQDKPNLNRDRSVTSGSITLAKEPVDGNGKTEKALTTKSTATEVTSEREGEIEQSATAINLARDKSKTTDSRATAMQSEDQRTKLASPVSVADNQAETSFDSTQIPGNKTIEEKQSSSPVTAEEARKNLPVPTRWTVAVSLSPDFSRTRTSGFYEPGAYFGLMVGYQVAPRFIITTGLMKTTKKYKGSGSEYTPPTGYWQYKTNGIVPDQITGNCKILEMPLLIQYAFVKSSKVRAYVSTGASSYFMRHESYQYSFDEPNPGAASGWKAQKPSRYILSVGHLSVGYERQLNSHLAIGIEPFLKIPFAGIGWSKIDLYTTGAYINARYRIMKRGTK